jgi:hypothetical protein
VFNPSRKDRIGDVASWRGIGSSLRVARGEVVWQVARFLGRGGSMTKVIRDLAKKEAIRLIEEAASEIARLANETTPPPKSVLDAHLKRLEEASREIARLANEQ